MLEIFQSLVTKKREQQQQQLLRLSRQYTNTYTQHSWHATFMLIFLLFVHIDWVVHCALENVCMCVVYFLQS